jgi:MarR family transcriptional regulator for hemolysin
MALLLLDKRDDGIMQRELACSMGIECASLAGLLDRMAADGWIERRPCSTDRRAKLVFLTAKSRGTLDEIHRIAHDVSRQLLEGVLPAKLAACEEVLGAIEARALLLIGSDHGGC